MAIKVTARPRARANNIPLNVDDPAQARINDGVVGELERLRRRTSVLETAGPDALFTATTAGDVPASGGGLDFLRADGTWVTPAGAGDVSHTRAINTTAPLHGGGDLSADRVLTVDVFGAAQPGVVPLSGGGAVNFLRADGAWAAPPAGAITSVTAGSSKTSVAPTVGAVVVDVVPANFTGIPETGVTNLVADLAARPTIQQAWIAASLRI